ncbi:MAG TPA: hypothetical protein VF192_01530 [Longimicrobiales bacterium]
MTPLDPAAIGRLAYEAQETAGRTPDAVIVRELRRAGIRGTMAEPAYRAAYLACERAWRGLAFPPGEARASRPRYGTTRTLTPAVLWAAYQAGETQHEIARRYGLGRNAVSKRSFRLGFRLQGARSGRVTVVVGPCVECGTPRPVGELDQRRRCRGGCAEAAA